jgi:hypothetical protein
MVINGTIYKYDLGSNVNYSIQDPPLTKIILRFFIITYLLIAPT